MTTTADRTTRVERVVDEPRGGLSPIGDLLASPLVSEAELAARGVAVEVVDCVAIGGGMGSFAWVDLLRNAGVPARSIAVVTDEAPGEWQYRRYVANSQMIPPNDRIRSNSESCPDNLWGFPGYAVREAWREARGRRLRAAAGLLWQIFAEPLLTETYTPRATDVFRGMDREAKRIGWEGMHRRGEVFAVRKTVEGRIVAIARRPGGQPGDLVAYAGQFVQLGVGYPELNVPADVEAFRAQCPNDRRVAQAYEPHEAIYRTLEQRGGTVILRGRGIVASRVVARLADLRRTQPGVEVVHLHRTRLTNGHTHGLGRRVVKDEFEFQPFNWPKGCWGGELKAAIEMGSDERRRELHEVLGGTSTADRGEWRRVVAEGRAEGWYQIAYGEVQSLELDGDRLRASVIDEDGETSDLVADFVIDCTGMVVAPEASPLLADLMGTYGVPRNGLGRIAVTNDFEIPAARNGESRLYACGAMTLGGPFASVDTFLGLEYSALRTLTDMHGAAPREYRPLHGFRSFRQWLKWVRGAPP